MIAPSKMGNRLFKTASRLIQRIFCVSVKSSAFMNGDQFGENLINLKNEDTKKITHF